jgi:hypothetical protein
MLPSNLSDPCELGFVSLGKLECKASKWADIRVLYEPLWYISIHSKSAQRPACVLTKYRAEFAKLGFVEVRQRWGEAEESRILESKPCSSRESLGSVVLKYTQNEAPLQHFLEWLRWGSFQALFSELTASDAPILKRRLALTRIWCCALT